MEENYDVSAVQGGITLIFNVLSEDSCFVLG